MNIPLSMTINVYALVIKNHAITEAIAIIADV